MNNVVEETKEQYGFNAQDADLNRKRGISQPKIEFPVRDHQNSNEMLGRPEENPYTSSSGSLDANEAELTPEVKKEPESIIASLTKNLP